MAETQHVPNTPHTRVVAGFQSKKELVDKIASLASGDLWLDRLNPDKGWSGVSNQKLMRMYAILTDVKQRFGSREKLIGAIVSAHGRDKDADYRKHFADWPLPRLVDALKSSEHRTRLATKAAERVAATAKPATKAKGATKAAPAKAAKSASTVAKKPAAAKPAAKAAASKSAKK
jgi:hypothetical protein